MTTEQRIQLLIGAQAIQVCQLQADLEIARSENSRLRKRVQTAIEDLEKGYNVATLDFLKDTVKENNNGA